MSKPEVASLRSQLVATVTAAARRMYPHDALPDEVYARVADKLVEAAEGSADTARTIEEGVAVLNDGRVFGLEGKSGHVTFRLLHVFEFRDGLIRVEKVWSDIASIAGQVE